MPTPKFQLGDRARVNEAGPANYRGRIFVITGIGAPSVYQIEHVDSGDRAGYLPGAWLDPVPATTPDEKTRQAVDDALQMLQRWHAMDGKRTES